MQTPSASDPSFKAFLEKLQEQNNRGFVSQLVQLKAERENAGEDNDKREKQLDDVILSLKEVRIAVTGVKIDIDLTPMVNIGENQTKLLEELNKEISLTRKLTEGSVEYDKEAAQYRNTSGRDIESKVSGKTSKDGGFIDFETARDTLSGQGKRAKEANAFDLKPINYTPGKAVAAAVSGKSSPAGGKDEEEDKSKYQGLFKEIESGFKFFMTDGLSEKPGHGIFQTPSKDVEKKDKEAEVSSPRQENPEADNVTSTGEIQADATKSDLELSKQMLDTTKAQLVELKAIREALAPKTPKDLVEQKGGPTTEKEKESEGGGSLLGDLASGAMDLMGGGKKAAGKIAGKAAGIGGKILGGAQALGSKAVGFANSGAGKLLGSVAAVGLGAYTAYEGYTAAEDSKQAKMDDVQAKVDSGQLKPEEAAAQRKEIGNTATVEKSGAIGEGTGMAAGAIAGAKLGAMAGTFIGGPVGTAIGGLAGGAIGAFAGSKAGKFVGEKVGSGINAVKGFFGGSTDEPGAATKEALAPAPATVKSETITTTDSQFNESKFGEKDPDTFKKYQEFIGKRTEEIAERDKVIKSLPTGHAANRGVYANAKNEAGKEARAKFKNEIDAVDAGEVKTKTEEKVTGGLGVKNPAPDQAKPASLGQDINENPMLALRAGRPDLMPTSNSKIPVVEKKTISGTAARTIPEEKGILSKAADTAKSIGSSIAGFFGFGDKKRPVDTAAPGKAVAVTPKETVDGKPAAVQPSGGDKFRDALSNAVGSAKQMVSNGEVDPNHLDEAVDQVMANVEGVSPQSANIIEKAVRAELQKGVKNPGERKSGKGAAVTPKETVDGKPAANAKGVTTDSAAFDKEWEAANADQDATEKYARSLNEIAMAEAKKGGRATPDQSDRRAAQIIARREALKTAGPGVTEGTLKGVEVTPGGVLKGGKISNTGKDVNRTSTENVDMGREAGKGGANNTVVSNNVSSNNTTKIVPMKANPRPEYTGSSLDRYTNRITVY